MNESWVQFDLGADYERFAFTIQQDNCCTWMTSHWKVQRWSASQNAWIDIMPYQAINTAAPVVYRPCGRCRHHQHPALRAQQQPERKGRRTGVQRHRRAEVAASTSRGGGGAAGGCTGSCACPAAFSGILTSRFLRRAGGTDQRVALVDEVSEDIRLPINGLVWSNKGFDRVIAVRSAHEGRASR